MRTRHTLEIVAVLACCLVAGSAAAQQGERLGTLAVTGVALDAESDPVGDTGSSIQLDDGYAVSFAFTWMARHTWSLETTFSLSRLETDAIAGSAAGTELGHLWTTWVTVGPQYHIPVYSRFEPVVGVGAVVVWPFADDLTSVAGDVGVGELKVDPDFGWTGNVGVLWHVSSSWAWRADVRYLSTDLDVRVRDTAGATVDTVRLPFDGWTVSLGGTWRF
jgi:outer membrane protein W